MPSSALPQLPSTEGALALARRIRRLEQAVQGVEVRRYPGLVTYPNGQPAAPGGMVIGDEVISPPGVGRVPEPSGLVLTSAADATSVWIDATWNASVSDQVVAYEVTWYETGSPFKTTMTVTRLSARIKPVIGGVSYTVEVRGVTNLGRTTEAITGTHTTAKDTTPPAQVTGVTVLSAFKGIIVQWAARTEADVVNGFGWYRVQVSTNSGFTAIVYDVRVSGTYHYASPLTAGTTYYVRVAAIDVSGNQGTYSATASTAVQTLITATEITPNSISTPQLAANAVTTDILAANQIFGYHIRSNEIDTHHLKVGMLFVDKEIRSTNYVAGAAGAGYRIWSNGVGQGFAEFNNITVRGTVFATSGTFTGNVDAAVITASTFSTASSGYRRIVMNSYDSAMEFHSSAGYRAGIYLDSSDNFIIRPSSFGLNIGQNSFGLDNVFTTIWGQLTITKNLYVTGDISVTGSLTVPSNHFFLAGRMIVFGPAGSGGDPSYRMLRALN